MNKPELPTDIVKLLRNVDEEQIRERLDELDDERQALRTLLRSVRAKRNAQLRKNTKKEMIEEQSLKRTDSKV